MVSNLTQFPAPYVAWIGVDAGIIVFGSTVVAK
jgi:hypothetical protein